MFGNMLRLLEVYNVDQSIMDKFNSPDSSRAGSNEEKHLRGDGYLVFAMDETNSDCSAKGYRTGTDSVFVWQVSFPQPNITVPETPPPTPPVTDGQCRTEACLFPPFFKWLCPLESGCEGCIDEEAVCQRLCRRARTLNPWRVLIVIVPQLVLRQRLHPASASWRPV